MTKVEFNYAGQTISILCKENDKFENIINRFCVKMNKSKDNFLFLYGGSIINQNATFKNIANSIDKQRGKMSILVSDISNDQDSELQRKYDELKEKLKKLVK